MQTNEQRIKGAYRAADYADVLQDEWLNGIAPGTSTGFYNLDPFYKVKKKQWTVVSGMPSSGKSTAVDNIMVNIAKEQNWKFLVCSPENQPVQRHIENLIQIYSGKRYIDPRKFYSPADCVTAEELAEGLKFIDSHFYFICPDETEFHIDYILNLATEIKHGFFDFDGFLIDPYNELEHKRPPGFTETEYISSLLSKVRRFVRAQDVHQWIVAHPTKQTAVPMAIENKSDLSKRKTYQRTSLYDIAGGAHWYNKCDNGLIVYRNEHLEVETMTIAVDKIRFRECGKKGSADFSFDPGCERLAPVASNI